MEGAPTPANGWGKGYADPSNVLINSTPNAIGSIDHDDLDIQGSGSVSTARQLLEQIKKSSWTTVGRKYNVTDNTIRKWVRGELGYIPKL